MMNCQCLMSLLGLHQAPGAHCLNCLLCMVRFFPNWAHHASSFNSCYFQEPQAQAFNFPMFPVFLIVPGLFISLYLCTCCSLCVKCLHSSLLPQQIPIQTSKPYTNVISFVKMETSVYQSPLKSQAVLRAWHALLPVFSKLSCHASVIYFHFQV